MKTLRNLCVLLCLSCLVSYGAETPEKLSPSLFQSPGNEYRSIYFYSLNDKLDTAVMDRQIKAFKEAGGAGVFLHARIGLLTPFLEQDWWNAMDAGVRACEKYHLQAWFYDEDKWPSGFAGGKVPLYNRDFLIESVLKVPFSQKLPPETRIICKDDSFSYIINKASWGEAKFNGTGYVDLMNPDVVKTFIEYGYKPYAERYKTKFGKSTFGMFTDEPQIQPRPTLPFMGAFSYSSVMPETFKKLNGYDLETVFPLLISHKPGWEKARIDYFRTMAYLFENSYFKQLGEYCKAHQMPFTGHMMGEESPTSVARYSGSNMLNYRHMQIPGIDQLALRYISPYTPRCMTSVANQYGLAKRLSEGFGISGQNMNFEDRKWLLDWHTLFGINTVTPHLSAYSLKGQRKRDYPPTFSSHQPYWEFNHIYEDYAARMCYAMSVGKYAGNIGVINPLETGYLEVELNVNNWEDEISKLTIQFLNQMQASHRDYDMVDEQIASEIGKSNREGFQVGEMTYKALILPNMKTIRKSTIQLLNDFSQKGGIVFYYGEFPYLVDGEPMPKVLEEFKKICKPLKSETLQAQLDDAVKPVFSLLGENANQIWSHLRITKGNGYILQLSNTSRIKGAKIELKFTQKPSDITLWNPVNGEAYYLKSNASGNYEIPFVETQTWIVTTGNATDPGLDKKSFPNYLTKSHPLQILSGNWKGTRVDPNAITLDYAAYSTDAGNHFSQPEPIIGIHQRFKDKKMNTDLQLKFNVDIRDIPRQCALVVEQPQMYQTIVINGNRVQFGDDWYLDAAFKKTDITQWLHPGNNEILLSLNYRYPVDKSLDASERYGTEIESVYLIGDFAVSGTVSDKPLMSTSRNEEGVFPHKQIHSFKAFTLTKEDQNFNGSLTLKGYPFYAGKFVLEKTFQMDQVNPGRRYFIEFPEFEAIVVQGELNGSKTAPMVFHPYEIEITPWVKKGSNTLRLILSNSLRNLLGPHHHVGGELVAVGPISFTGKTSWTGSQVGENDWYEKRLSGTPGIWRDDYYLIPFGILAAPIIVER